MSDRSLRHTDGVCPVTGKPMTDPKKFTWSDHSKPGNYNSCLDCSEWTGVWLPELNRRREQLALNAMRRARREQ